MRIALAFSLSLVSTALWADVAGSQDLSQLARFPGAQIVNYQQLEQQQKLYPQGTIRRISGKLRYEREVAGSGDVTRITYELPNTHSATEVFEAARNELLSKHAELLYWCVGRECGASSLWANEVFANAQLYGSDDQQSYALLRLAEPEHDTLLALYGITRGNRRAYLHAELFTASAPLGQILPSPATLQRQLKSAGELNLPQQSAPSDEWVELLARSLNLDSTLRVSLAGAQAPAWREALLAQRVRASRLELDEVAVSGLQLKVLR